MSDSEGEGVPQRRGRTWLRWLLSAAAWVHLVVLTRLAVRLPCFLWGIGCACGPGVRRRIVAVLLESTRADWRALDVVAASSPSSSQDVRKDELLFARGRGRAWAALGCGGCSSVEKLFLVSLQGACFAKFSQTEFDTWQGGGIYISSSSTVTLTSCTVSDNTAVCALICS